MSPMSLMHFMSLILRQFVGTVRCSWRLVATPLSPWQYPIYGSHCLTSFIELRCVALFAFQISLTIAGGEAKIQNIVV